MVFQCPRCGKNDFKKTCDLTNHLNRKFKCKQTTDLFIEDLANWLTNPEIKNNPTIINKKIPKTDAEWFDLMEEFSSKRQKKTKVSQPGPTTQVHKEGDFEEDPKDLDKKCPGQFHFQIINGIKMKVWQKGIQMAKDIFKVD